MVVTIGKVVDGRIVVDGTVLSEGQVVGVLIGDVDEPGFVLSPGDEAELLDRMAGTAGGADRDAEEHLRQLRGSLR